MATATFGGVSQPTGRLTTWKPLARERAVVGKEQAMLRGVTWT